MKRYIFQHPATGDIIDPIAKTPQEALQILSGVWFQGLRVIYGKKDTRGNVILKGWDGYDFYIIGQVKLLVIV